MSLYNDLVRHEFGKGATLMSWKAFKTAWMRL